MERAIEEMEKIRRAEEIYSKRKGQSEEVKKISFKNIYKFLFEGLVLINIVIVIVAVKNQKYIFTKEFIKQVNSYNVNFKKKIEEFFENSEKDEKSSKPKDENTVQNTNSSSVSGEVNNVTSALVENEPKEIKELSQEEKDIDEIKNNYTVVLPLSNFVKTSGYGERTSSNSKVTKNHTGVDLATDVGTPIYSATTGKVIEVSSAGDYGKHLKVQTENLVVLYAHCSKINAKVGQDVKMGEKIAEVGSTRKFYWTTSAF